MATFANQGVSSQMAFGQFGSAFTETNAGVLVPPQGMVITAIQALDDTKFDILISERPDTIFSVAHAAHATTNDTVSGVVTAGTFVDMDGDATAKAGDAMHLASTGAFVANVKAVGFDSAGEEDASFIELDRRTDVTAAAHIFVGSEGSGGQAFTADNVVPKGMTIYGRWTAMSLAADQTSGGAICYFGPTDSKK